MKTTDDLRKMVKELISKNNELQNELESLKSTSISQNK
jgi:regulator of replication initiation timing